MHTTGNVASAVDKFTVPVVAWLTHLLHIALPDLVLLATLIYTVLQIVAILRSRKKVKQTTEDEDNGS